MSEQWTEIRCFACVPLGWYSSHLLLRVSGIIEAQDVKLEMKCPRCKSVILWTYGKPEFMILKDGIRNQRRQTTAFE